MDRFLEESAADLAANYARHLALHVWGELPKQAYPNECQNCGKLCERLTYIPEFDYQGCDDCVAEAQTAIASELQLVDAPTCPALLVLIDQPELTVADLREILKAHDSATCAACGSTRKTVVSCRLSLGTPGAACCGDVA
jgi:hypothetical protein